MNLRNHQEECIENIEYNFLENKKGLVKMFCGSGKSLIIYHSLIKYCSDLVVLVVPSISLINQFNTDYMLNPLIMEFNRTTFNKQFDFLSMCSKNELSDEYQHVRITTDIPIILHFLQQQIPKILIVTYQSLSTFITILQQIKKVIDLICFDEAHHILGEQISNFLFNENDVINSLCDKILFFTATPKNTKNIKMYENITELVVNNEEFTIVDRINELNNGIPVCGPLLYEYYHRDGVLNNILNDFQIRIEMYSENKPSTIFETISRAILETGNNKVLTFHARSEKQNERSSNVVSFSSINNKEMFEDAFQKVLLEEFPHRIGKYKQIHFVGITAKTKNKSSILDAFDRATPEEIFILSSCKTIGEGVDTKTANMVCFIDPKQSYTEIIQNIGRVCRKNELTQNLSTVLLPVYLNMDNFTNCTTTEQSDWIIRREMENENGNFNGILSVLSALKQEDPYLFELCLKYPNTYTHTEFKKHFKRFNLLLDDTEYTIEELFTEFGFTYEERFSINENLQLLSTHLEKNIKIFCRAIDEKNIRINKKFELDQVFLKTENNTYFKVLGTKEPNTHIPKPNRNIKPFVHADERIKVLWGITNPLNETQLNQKVFGCFIETTVIANTKEVWLDMYEKILADNVQNMHKYASWISKNKQNYKNNTGIFKHPEIRQLWEELKQDEQKGSKFYSKKETWYIKLEEFQQYLFTQEYEEDILNNTSFGNKYQSFLYWKDRNMKNYRTNKSVMMDEEVKQDWERFMYDEKYYEVFKFDIYTSQYNIDKWKNNLSILISRNQLKKNNVIVKFFLYENLTEEEKNAVWLNKMSDAWVKKNNELLQTKNEIMESKEVFDLWENFVKNNPDYNSINFYTSPSSSTCISTINQPIPPSPLIKNDKSNEKNNVSSLSPTNYIVFSSVCFEYPPKTHHKLTKSVHECLMLCGVNYLDYLYKINELKEIDKLIKLIQFSGKNIAVVENGFILNESMRSLLCYSLDKETREKQGIKLIEVYDPKKLRNRKYEVKKLQTENISPIFIHGNETAEHYIIFDSKNSQASYASTLQFEEDLMISTGYTIIKNGNIIIDTKNLTIFYSKEAFEQQKNL